MPNRRKVLIGLGGSVALAGCTGETDEEEPEPEEEEPEEDTPTETPEETESEEETEEEEQVEEVSEFVLSDLSPTNDTFEQGEEIEASVIVENEGNIEDTKEITTEFDGNIVDTEEYTIGPNNEKTHSYSIDTTDNEPDEYDLVVFSEDDELSTTLEVIISLEENMEIMGSTLSIFGLNLVEWSKEGEELHIHYETTSTESYEIVDDMMSVEEAYLAALNRGLETERIIAEMSEPGEDPIARYTVETEWSNQLTEGTITESEMEDKIIDTLEYT